MANDYIVRLQGQDNLSGTIRNAQRSINELGGSANRLDAIQQRFNRIEQSSAPLNKKLKDVKRAMEQLAITGDTSSELFQRMAQAAQRYQQALEQVNQATRRVDSASGQMNGRLGNLRGMAGEVASSAGLGGIASSLAAIANPAGATVAAVGAVAAVMVKAGKAAAEFETSLASMGALTGLGGSDLESLGNSARELAKTYGSSATEVLASMETIGSQAPVLLKNKEALVAVTDAANVLAKAGGMEVDAAAKAITTTMNQMGVSADEAMNIVNTLGAGSQQGAAGIEYLNVAFEKAGTQAKAAGMSYSDLTAAIETVAPKFSSADVAGSQLSSTLLALSMASNEYNPQVVGMSKALENLSAAELNNAQMKDLVGASNITMLSTLIESREEFDKYSQSLVGTTTAQDQAAQKMDTFNEKMNRLTSSWDDFLISLGQSAPVQDIMDLVIALGEGLMEVVNALVDVWDALTNVDDVCEGMITPMDALIAVWDALVAIVKGCIVAVEIVIRAVHKLEQIFIQAVKDGCLNAWNKFKDSVSKIQWVQSILNGFKQIGDYFKGICDYILKLWNKMCDTLGMEDKKVSLTAAPSVAPAKATSTTSTSDDTPANTNSGSTGSTKTGSGGRGSKGSTPKKDAPEVESQKYWEALIAAENTYRQNHKLTTEEIEASNKKLADYNKSLEEVKKSLETPKKLTYLEELDKSIKDTEEELKKLNPNDSDFGAKVVELSVKLRADKDAKQKFLEDIGQVEVKPQAKVGSQTYIEQQLSEKQTALKMEVVGSDEWKALSKEIADLTDQQHIIDVQIANNLSEDDAKKLIAFDEAFTATMDKVKGQAGVIDTIGGSFSQLGGAIGGTAGKMLEFAGQSAQAVAQIIPQIVALIGAKQGEALASGTASAAALPFPANIAAIASIIATITALFASFAGSFADGGIISGGSFHGDKMLARVNAGEMILNPMQQSNLFNALNGGGAVGGMRNVEFKISGSTLKGCLNNYDKKQSRLK